MKVGEKPILILLALALTAFVFPAASQAQTRKMIVGQAGVNPGAGLFTIAVNQSFYKKHGLDVEIIKTNTTAAVQAMLAGKMQMATGAGAAAGRIAAARCRVGQGLCSRSARRAHRLAAGSARGGPVRRRVGTRPSDRGGALPPEAGI